MAFLALLCVAALLPGVGAAGNAASTAGGCDPAAWVEAHGAEIDAHAARANTRVVRRADLEGRTVLVVEEFFPAELARCLWDAFEHQWKDTETEEEDEETADHWMLATNTDPTDHNVKVRSTRDEALRLAQAHEKLANSPATKPAFVYAKYEIRPEHRLKALATELFARPSVRRAVRRLESNTVEAHRFPVAYVGIADMFVAAYKSGNFLTAHDDQALGVTFNYHLARGWSPENGGQLAFYCQPRDLHPEPHRRWKGRPPCATFEAGFNTVSIFRAQAEPVLFHNVTEIVGSPEHPRYSITGWYRLEGQSEAAAKVCSMARGGRACGEGPEWRED
jgi:Rps23 Pro-64 3,4-dihydroxylase Tpa1-like proline 4-hydroxylase